MADILKLLDSAIPLQKRYDSYLEWDNQYSIISPHVTAEKLEIGIAHVEVFLDLGKLSPEEFAIIDNNKIGIDYLLLIVKEGKERRLEIYENFSSIIANTTEPIKSLRNFIDGSDEPLLKEKLAKISPRAYYSIAQYLKQTSTTNGTITKPFRGLLVSVGKLINAEKEMSDKQSDWIIRAITHDNIHTLKVFTNDILKNDCPEDFEIFREIISILTNISK